MGERDPQRHDEETQRGAYRPASGDQGGRTGGSVFDEGSTGAMGAASDPSHRHTEGGWESMRGDFRQHWEERFGGSGESWSMVEPGYHYGYELANDPRYRDRDWATGEAEFRSNYTTWANEHGYRGDDSGWDRLKERVREGWQRVRDAMTQ